MANVDKKSAKEGYHRATPGLSALSPELTGGALP